MGTRLPAFEVIAVPSLQPNELGPATQRRAGAAYGPPTVRWEDQTATHQPTPSLAPSTHQPARRSKPNYTHQPAGSTPPDERDQPPTPPPDDGACSVACCRPSSVRQTKLTMVLDT